MYSQRTTSTRRGSPVEFVQIDSPEGRVAGTLVGRMDFPVSQYLNPHSQAEGRSTLNWPPHRRGEALFVEFDPPMEEWPSIPEGGRPQEQRAVVMAYDSDGVPFTDGRARRRVWHDGVESAGTPAGTFEHCTRLRADTDLRFGWWAGLHVYETAWISPQAGIVRRTERITGHAMILFRFDSTYEYNLQAIELAPRPAVLTASPAGDDQKNDDRGNSETTPEPRGWSRIAIHIERAASRPRVAGLAVDWGAPRP